MHTRFTPQHVNVADFCENLWCTKFERTLLKPYVEEACLMQAPSGNIHIWSPKQPMYCVWKISKGIEMWFWICLVCVCVCAHICIQCRGWVGVLHMHRFGAQRCCEVTHGRAFVTSKELYHFIRPLGHCDCTYLRGCQGSYLTKFKLLCCTVTLQ